MVLLGYDRRPKVALLGECHGGKTRPVDRTDLRLEGDLDLATILAVGVAALIVFCSYFLFHGMPSPRSDAQPKRSSRRT